MHDPFISYVEHGKALALSKGLDWNFVLDAEGYSDAGWNLTLLTGASPPIQYFRDLGLDPRALETINKQRLSDGLTSLHKHSLDNDWQDLLKAAVCEQLLFKRNGVTHVVNGIVRPLKVLATCCQLQLIKPWNLTHDIIDQAATIANTIQPSGQLSDIILGLIKNLIDTNHLALNCPLRPGLTTKRSMQGRDRRSKVVKSKNDLLEDLSDRKSLSKLPEQKAFWELMRIVFTEQPKSFTDMQRFAAVKVMLITGLRIGECVFHANWTLIPRQTGQFRRSDAGVLV